MKIGSHEIKARALQTFEQKIIGLIGKEEISPVYFQTYGAIHTFGMLRPIDVLILNKNYEVMKLVEFLRPNRIFFWNPKYSCVIELPTKTIMSRKIKIGDKIVLVEE